MHRRSLVQCRTEIDKSLESLEATENMEKGALGMIPWVSYAAGQRGRREGMDGPGSEWKEEGELPVCAQSKERFRG